LIAYSALAIWPVVTFLLFQTLSSKKAIVWATLGGFLLLPVGTWFDAPGMPKIDKTVVANLSLLVCALLFAKFRILRLPKSKLLIGLLALYVLSPVVTTLSNRDPLMLSVSMLPGMTLYDGASLLVRQLIEVTPFLVAYNAYKAEQDIRGLLVAIIISALAYSVPILWEVRMSPQLHAQLYGFFPHDFSQQMRAGGFRAVVFLGHGLVVAIFIAMALVAAIALWRTRTKIIGISGAAYTSVLLIVLILCKSAGALILAIFVGAASYFMRYRNIISVLAISGLIIVSYPALRGFNIIPVNSIAEMATSISSDRSSSFRTRIENEDILLEKISEKPLFGWGAWGRGRIYKTGWTGDFDYDATITDGSWIIIMSTFGWVGYIACFGLLAFPTARALYRRKRFDKYPSFVALLAVLVVNLFDLLPNSSLTPLTWLIAGALSGFDPGSVRGALSRKEFSRSEENSAATTVGTAK